MRIAVILTVLVVAISQAVSKEEVATDLQRLVDRPSRCTYDKAFGMYGAYCAGLKLTSFPHYLKSGIEILEMSDNKIRELQADTFARFTSIKYLYLAENSIYLIERDAFTPLTSLETLDLTKNAITSIPDVLFNIPTLRRLHLGGNALVHFDSDLQNLQRPIKAPLEQLDLSDCRIRHVPDLGIMPELKVYNLSLNSLTSLEPMYFAKTCKLERVDLVESLKQIKLCDLRITINWLTQKSVSFILEDYTRLNSDEFYACPIQPFPDNLNETYIRCLAENVHIQVTKTSRRTWLTVTGGLAGFLVAFMLLLYVMHRNNVAQTKKPVAAVHKPKNDGDKNANVNLLENGPR